MDAWRLAAAPLVARYVQNGNSLTTEKISH